MPFSALASCIYCISLTLVFDGGGSSSYYNSWKCYEYNILSCRLIAVFYVISTEWKVDFFGKFIVIFSAVMFFRSGYTYDINVFSMSREWWNKFQPVSLLTVSSLDCIMSPTQIWSSCALCVLVGNRELCKLRTESYVHVRLRVQLWWRITAHVVCCVLRRQNATSADFDDCLKTRIAQLINNQLSDATDHDTSAAALTKAVSDVICCVSCSLLQLYWSDVLAHRFIIHSTVVGCL